MKIFTFCSPWSIDQVHECKVPRDKCFYFFRKAQWGQFFTPGGRLHQMMEREEKKKKKAHHIHASGLCIIHACERLIAPWTDSWPCVVRDGLSICQKCNSFSKCCCVLNGSWQLAQRAFTPAVIAYDNRHKSITLTRPPQFCLCSGRTFSAARRRLFTALFRANRCPRSIRRAHSLGQFEPKWGLILQKLPGLPCNLHGSPRGRGGGSNSSRLVWRQEEVQT